MITVLLSCMGNFIEFNDTLQITTAQGFPEELLNIKKHKKDPITLAQVEKKVFSFCNKENARHFHTPPTRCFLVHNINGKWLYWGKIMVLEQTITSSEEGKSYTSGKYKIIQIYKPVYQEAMTKQESPTGKSYF